MNLRKSGSCQVVKTKGSQREILVHEDLRGMASLGGELGTGGVDPYQRGGNQG